MLTRGRGAVAAGAVLVFVLVALFVYDVIQPAVIVLGYFTVPVLLSAALDRPRFTGFMAGLTVVLAAITAQVNDYWSNLNVALNLLLLVVLCAVSVGISVMMSRGSRRRDQALRRMAGAMNSEMDAHVFLAPLRGPSGEVLDFEYRAVNPVACAMFSRGPADLVGHRMLELFPDSSREAIAGMVTVADTGAPFALNRFRLHSVATDDFRYMDLRAVRADGEVSVSWRDVTAEVLRARQLADSERRSRLLLENSTDVIWESDNEGVTTWISPSLERVSGWRPSDLVGQPFTDFVHPGDIPVLAAARRQVAAGEHAAFEIRVRTRQGGYIWVAVRAAQLLDEQGRVVGRSGGWRDIDEQVRARMALEAAEARFRMLATETSDVIMQVGSDGVVQWASPSAVPSLGWNPRDLVDRPVADFVHPDDITLIDMLFATINLSEPRQATLRLRQPGSGHRWVDIACDSLGAPDRGWVVRIRDVEDQVRGIQELELQAATDPVTGLANRLAALRQLRQITGERRGDNADAVLFVDLDHFKQINDTYGHQAGDEVLRIMGQRIVALTRGSDFVARFGGDELLVLLKGIGSLDQAALLAEQIRRTCSEPIAVGDGIVRTTVSVGVAVSRPGEDMEHIMQRVDAALYRAKEAGRDSVALDAG